MSARVSATLSAASERSFGGAVETLKQVFRQCRRARATPITRNDENGVQRTRRGGDEGPGGCRDHLDVVGGRAMSYIARVTVTLSFPVFSGLSRLAASERDGVGGNLGVPLAGASYLSSFSHVAA